MRRLSALVIPLATFAPPMVARADAQSEAKAHFSRGVDLYGKGSYEAALDEFKTSYRLRAVPVVLFNIAETYTALDRFDDAMTYLGMYTAGVPTDTLEPGPREQVKELENRIKRATGTVRVVGAPDGASVLVDGKELPNALVRPAYVGVGHHVISVTHAEYAPWKRTFRIEPGDAEVLKVELTPRPREATLKVQVKPSDASLLVDGRAPVNATKSGSASVVSLRPGWHEVELRKAGMTSMQTVLELRGGETREVSAELLPSPKPSVFASPWFWAGVGLVVGGVAGYAIAHAP